MKDKNKTTPLRELTLKEAVDGFLWYFRKYKLEANVIQVANASEVLDALLKSSTEYSDDTQLNEIFDISKDRDIVYTMEGLAIEKW